MNEPKPEPGVENPTDGRVLTISLPVGALPETGPGAPKTLEGRILRGEQDTLREELVKAKLQRDLASLTSPWWKSWNVTVVAALLAAVTPATAGVQSWIQRDKEIALERMKFEHDATEADERQTADIRNGYLDRMRDPNERRRTLRFLDATTKDANVRRWSEEELGRVDQEVKDLDAKLAAAAKAADDADHAAEIAVAKDPKRLADLLVQRAADRRTVVQKYVEIATRWSAAGGTPSAAKRPLSERLRSGLDLYMSCVTSGASDAATCRDKAHFAQIIPAEADIKHARELELAAPEDPAAYKQLVILKTMFLMPEGAQ